MEELSPRSPIPLRASATSPSHPVSPSHEQTNERQVFSTGMEAFSPRSPIPLRASATFASPRDERKVRFYTPDKSENMLVTTTLSGALTKLHVVGDFLDENLSVKDASGQVQSGVGMLLQHEPRFGIYVASLTPKGPADECGKIKIDDVLLTIDGYTIQSTDSLASVQRLVLGRPGTSVTLSFERRPTLQQYNNAIQYTTHLVRKNNCDPLRNILAEAQKEITKLRQENQSLVIQKSEQALLLNERALQQAKQTYEELQELQQVKQTCEDQKALLVRATHTCVEQKALLAQQEMELRQSKALLGDHLEIHTTCVQQVEIFQPEMES